MKFGPFTCASLLLCACTASAHAVTVSYFNDPDYVDTSRESLNLRNELVGLGHTPVDFTTTTDAAWSAALSAADVLVIPELERGSLASALSISVKSDIAAFVGNGGNLVIAGDIGTRAVTLLNDSFGWSILSAPATSSGNSSRTAAAAATPFGDGPAFIDNLDGTFLVTGTSLPGSGIELYRDTGSVGQTSVFAAPVADGTATYIGYDWFLRQDAALADVLDTAVLVPEPASLTLLGAGGLTLIRRGRRRPAA